MFAFIGTVAGATYNEDMSYVFGAPITDGLDPFSAASYSRGEKSFSENVLKYWTNFIKTGSVENMLIYYICATAKNV